MPWLLHCLEKPVHNHFPDSSVGEESACNARDPSLIPGSRRSTGEGIGYPLKYCRAFLVAQLVKNLPAMQETGFNSWVRKIPWKRDRLPTPVFSGFPGGSAGKESACNVEDLCSIPGLGRSPGEGNSYPLQYCGLENSMGCIAHGVAKSRTRLSDLHFHSTNNVLLTRC